MAVRTGLAGGGGGSAREDCMTRRAFSLVELVAVVLIVGIVAALAAPRVGSALARQRLDGAARRVVADLALAQRAARAASASRSVTFSTATGGYTVSGVDDPNQAGAPYVVDLGAEPYGAELISVLFTGGSVLTFDGFGRPSSGGGVMLRCGNGCRRVVVDANTGAATVREVTCPSKGPPAVETDTVVDEPATPRTAPVTDKLGV